LGNPRIVGSGRRPSACEASGAWRCCWITARPLIVGSQSPDALVAALGLAFDPSCAAEPDVVLTRDEPTQPPSRGASPSPCWAGPRHSSDFDRILSGRFGIISIGRDALARAGLPFRSGRFLVLREDEAPAEMIRLGWSLVLPGNVGKEMARIETRFLEKPHRGPGEGTHGNGFGRAKNPLLLPL